MRTLDFLGLDESKVKGVVGGLSQLLADFQVYYTNLRGFHWNVRGKSFFVMHAKYEELYNDAAEKIDELAERILQLGAVPESKFSEYLKQSDIREQAPVERGREAREALLGWLKVLIAKEREVLSLASESGDEVTVSLMSDYLKGQEKMLWMLVAYGTRHDHDGCKCEEK
ncbi:DNA starvation/stationary phase protection protein [Prevotella sp. oral taxon 376]|uniref:Dps family protein n=1 Tax=Prevotella sp. oral taxon 376 TaxID=712466 RepID=UPI000D1DD4A6|nr:Dps family protein [Prevotella sp. oral taxon 376]PTL32271.1 DNA starvation/stationary phase protection protein [Prevotella sp. oral taxon 376]